MNKKNHYMSFFWDDLIDKKRSLQIDYHVRIHDSTICECNRIKKKCPNITNNSEKKLILTLEKMWNNDKIYKNRPDQIFIYGDINGKYLILNKIFQNHLVLRKKVHDYFKEYKWCAKNSEEIRKKINNMICICFCRYNLLSSENSCNAGIILIGDRVKMNMISHGFNKYIEKKEFSELLTVRLDNFIKIPTERQDHSIQSFINSSEIKELSELFYTILGRKSDINNVLSNDNKIEYSFSFGKREWFPDYPETSLECARRELYEEFNIQLSKNIFNYSATIKKPQIIHKPGTILYLIYVPFETTIIYHKNSETLYLDC